MKKETTGRGASAPSGLARGGGKRILLPALAVLAVAAMVAVPLSVAIDSEGTDSGTVIDLDKFLNECVQTVVINGDDDDDTNDIVNIVYEGNPITVKWSPTSECKNNLDHTCYITKEHVEAGVRTYTGNSPWRAQDSNAQFWIFEGATDVTISNVTFIYEPETFALCANKDGTQYRDYELSGDTYVNAEFQFWNTGNLTLTNCVFDQVIVSPYFCLGTTSISGCTFENVYDAYAIKDVKSYDVIVDGNTFTNCSGGIYVNANTSSVGKLTITDNTFIGMDNFSTSDKVNGRGLIQLYGKGDYTQATVTITGNTSNNDAPFIRQKCYSVDDTVLDLNALKANNSVSGEIFVYTTHSGSLSTILAGYYMGSTITVTDATLDGTYEITKSVTISGGSTVKTVTGTVNIPNVVGYVKFINLDFTNAKLSYDSSKDYSQTEIIFEGCTTTNFIDLA